MTRFIDQYAPDEMPGFPCRSSPRWSTRITQVDSGAEHANQRWAHPLYKFTLPDAAREAAIWQRVRDHWLVMRGPLHTWPFRDPLDFASRSLDEANTTPVITGMDQVIGTGDGAKTTFQLVKTYTVGAQSYERTIYLPIVSTVLVTINGVNAADYLPGSPTMTWSVTRLGGQVTFSEAPQAGHIVRAGYLFDVEVRFADDNAFDSILVDAEVGGYADITLFEVRPC